MILRTTQSNSNDSGLTVSALSYMKSTQLTKEILVSLDCNHIVAQVNKAENLQVLSCSDVDSVAPID